MRPRWRVATYAPGGRPIGQPTYFVRRRNAERHARDLTGRLYDTRIERLPRPPRHRRGRR